MWKYRKTEFIDFSDTTAEPTLFELVPITSSDHTISLSLTDIVLDSMYGDLTNIFVPGYQFRILNSLNNDATYTVASSSFTSQQTTVTIDSSFVDTGTGDVVPLVTSQGDEWRGYHQQVWHQPCPGPHPSMKF